MNQYPHQPGQYPYPQQQGGYPQGPYGQPSPQPPGKKPFKFESWMLGLVILPIGIGIAIVSFMQRHTVEAGGGCSDDEQCKVGSCLQGSSGGVCASSCSADKDCGTGFACTEIKVTLQNQGGFHDLGKQRYCMRAQKVSSSSN